MTITPYQFWYDSQQRRFLEQIVRAFSGFSYQTGMRDGAAPQTVMVPCRMALSSRVVANIISNLSENTLNTVPMITVWQTGLRGRHEDLQNPAFIDHLQAFERNIVDGRYGADKGNAYAVDRLMPLPFLMEVQVDIYTSNLEQKHMLAEQILVAMYPQFQIQNSDNVLDWTAVTICFMEDDIQWSSRTIPIGTENEIDIMTLRLRIPIWLSPPAKVKALHRIEEVIANVGQEVQDTDGPLLGTLFQRVIVTPGDLCISVNGNSITLLAEHGHATLPDNSIPSWANLFKLYGTFSPGESELRLYLTSDIEGPFVAGTLQYGNAPNLMVWTLDVDTLPANTLQPVDAVIDPLRTSPGNGLPAASDGTRYLLINDIGPSVAWGNLTAFANDIIEYKSSSWQVVFDARNVVQQQYVLNLYTTRQLFWNAREWLLSIDTFYTPGYWRLAL